LSNIKSDVSSKQRFSFIKACIDVIISIAVAFTIAITFAVIACASIIINVRVRIDERCSVFISVTIHLSIFICIHEPLIIITVNQAVVDLDMVKRPVHTIIVFES